MLILKIRNAIFILVLSIFTLIIISVVALNFPFAHRFITGKVNSILSNAKIPIKVNYVKLILPNAVTVEGVNLYGNNGDTIIYVERLNADISPLALLRKQVIIPSASLGNSRLTLLRNNQHVKINIAEAFSKIPRKKVQKKKWEVSVNNVNISVLKFLMSDSVKGIQIEEDIAGLRVTTSKMSIIEKSILFCTLDVDGAKGSIRISDKPETIKSAVRSPWIFGLERMSLKNISHAYCDLTRKLNVDFLLDEGIIKSRKTDINNKILDFSKVSLSGTKVILALNKGSAESKKKRSAEPATFPWDISASDLDLEKVSIQVGENIDTTMDKTHFQFGISNLNMSLSDIKLNNKITGITINSMNFNIRNGFSLKKMKGELNSESGITKLNFALETGNSFLNFDGDFKSNFTDLLKTPQNNIAGVLSINNSGISLKDLFYFKPELRDVPYLNALSIKPLSVEGRFILKDSVLGITAFTLSQTPNFTFSLHGNIKNSFTPKVAGGELQFGITGLNTRWLKDMVKGAGIKNNIPDFSRLSVSGTISDSSVSPSFSIKLLSDFGNIDLTGKYDFTNDVIKIHSIFETIKLDRILGKNEIGSFTGDVELTGNGIKQKSFRARAILSVESLRLKGYDYTKGIITCNIVPSEYDIGITFDDPSLSLDMKAGLMTEKSGLSFKTSGKIKARMNDLKLLKDTLAVEGNFEADLKKELTSYDGNIQISDLKLITPGQVAFVRQISTSLRSDTSETILSGKSDFYDYAFQVKRPVNELKTIISGYSDYIKTFMDPHQVNAPQRITYLPEMNTKINIRYHEVVEIILKGFHYENIDIELINNISERKLVYSIGSKSIKYKAFEFGMLNTQITDSAGILNVDLEAINSFVLSRPTNKLNIKSKAAGWKSLTSLSLLDDKNDLVYGLDIGTEVDSNNIYLKIPSKQLTLDGVQWQVESGELLTYNFALNKIYPVLRMKSNGSFINLIGEGNKKDGTFKCDLKDVEVTSLLPERIIMGNPGGFITGSTTYSSSEEKGRKINTDLIMRNVRWSDMMFNNISLNGSFISGKEGEWGIDMHSSLDSSELVLKGEKSGLGNKTIIAGIKSFQLKTMEPFLKKYLSDLGGYLSGNFEISTKNDIENLDGEILIKDGNLKIISLNTGYRIPDGKIGFSGKKMVLNKFTILDSLDNKLQIDGYVDFSVPKSIYTDLEASSANLQIMNKGEDSKSSLYGQIFINSDLSIRGPLVSPVLKGKINLTKGTDVYYVKKEDLKISESEKVLKFVTRTHLENQTNIAPTSKPSKFKNPSVETLVEIDPDTRINFNLSQNLYNTNLRIKGGGSLQYNLLINNQMNLSGKYEIGEGAANVKMVGWPNKLFRITSGGFIRWDGNISDPTLQLEALNKVRSSYTNPIDGKLREVDFNVILRLTNRLSDLNLVFTINTPDQYLMSIINTLSPQEQMRQAITILLFEKIDLPGISTSTDYVTEQVNQILASQLNSLTKTTIQGIDISFGIDSYKSTSSTGGEQTKTSLSYDVKKTLLNNRAQIQISGRFNDYSNQQSNSNMSLNNFSFEYRLDSAATKFVKVYNQHTYEDVFEGEIIKTGVGFIYRKSYPSLGDIWRRNDRKKIETPGR